MATIKTRSTCPVGYSLDIFGDRWTILILRDMIFAGKSSYLEFMNSPEKISTNILADRLKFLETQCFVSKKESPVNKSKFIYTLTQKAIELLPIIAEMIIWGTKHHPEGLPTAVSEELKNNKSEVIERYTNMLQQKLENSEAE